jgi:hypothetical protein
MASAGVLAVNPVIATPAKADVRVAAVELAALSNPITEWQNTFANTFTALSALGTGVSASATALTQALGNPAVHAQFAGVFTGINPQRFQNTLAALPGYASRLGTANAESTGQFQEALAALPGVLQLSAGFLAQGRFLESFAEINLWFLTAGLSDLRGSMLDALRVPGDFLDSIGLEPLARILGTSWMVTTAPGAQINGPGLLSRGVIGNLGRALLAPQVTAMFQTVEILDAVRAAVVAGDVQTAIGELINAPARIANAFLNGYIPAFITDPDSPIPPGPGQTFPGLLSSTGTLDFFFRQIPEEIAKALQFPRPAPAAPPAPDAITTSGTDSTPESGSPSDIPLIADSQLVSLKAPAPAAETAPTLEGSTDPTTVGSTVGIDGDGTAGATDPTDTDGVSAGENTEVPKAKTTRGTWSRGANRGTWGRGTVTTPSETTSTGGTTGGAVTGDGTPTGDAVSDDTATDGGTSSDSTSSDTSSDSDD